MPTDHNIRQLVINKMTDAQYEQAVKSADELYLTPDTGGGGGGSGTVTSVRVQATSPVVSSQSTEQTTTLNTTISLANNYGDTKNPYASKTKNYVLAAPSTANGAPTFRALTKADIPLASETAASGGTTTSLVTTGEKYTWNNKQNALTTQTAYSAKGTATKVPQITTNTLGQVTGITEVDITHPTELPSQTGQSGKFLTTDGSSVSWATVQGGSNIDNSTIIKNTNDELQTVGVKDVRTNNTIKTWTGTKAQYDAASIITWTNSANLDSNHYWYALTHGNGKFIAIDADAYISTSTDGINWTNATQDSNLSYNWKWMCATYGGGKFVALSQFGGYSSSTDGTTWEEASNNLDGGMSWYALTYGNNKFVAISEDAYVSTSTDGITWTSVVQDINLNYGSNWHALAYNGTKFVALSTDGSVSASTDGTTWAEATYNNNLGNNYWTSLVYDGTKFVAISDNGYISTSIDGNTWTTAVQDNSLNSIGNYWNSSIVSNGRISVLNEDGKIATQIGGIDNNTLYNIENYGLYLGTIKIANTSKDLNIDNSTITKNESDELQTIGIKDVRTNNTIKTWTGTRTQYNNLNSDSWSVAAQDSNLSTYTNWLVTYGDGKFVAINGNGGNNGRGYVSTSNNGTTWNTLTHVNNLDSDDIGSWISLAYGNGKFVAISIMDYISTSTDGIIWTTPTYTNNLGTLGENYWESIAYGNGKFVAIDDNQGYVSTSTDGITWTTLIQISDFYNINHWKLTYGNGKFVALSIYGYISTSTDGTTWTAAIQDSNLEAIDLQYDSSWTSLVYDGTKFVAISSNGCISTSTDGTTWAAITQVNNLGDNNWMELVYDETKVVAVSVNCYISTKISGLHSDTLYNIINKGLYLGSDRISSAPEEIEISTASITLDIAENTIYEFTNAVTSLTISSVVKSYLESMIYFTTGSSITFTDNSTLKWRGGTIPSLEVNTTYCIAIKNGLAEIDKFGR